jgi:arginyl-tRNA synthetase
VIVDDPAVRARRLLLCARTLLVLETGLGLLGLRTPPVRPGCISARFS